MNTDLADMAFWWPILSGCGVLVPRTAIIRTGVELARLLDGEIPKGYGDFIGGLGVAANAIGWPIFLRTGHTSGKHEARDTCFCERPEDLSRHVARLVEYSHMVDFAGLPTDTWAVRERLSVKPFEIAGGGLLIVPEIRLFLRDHMMQCLHVYWPLDALVQRWAGFTEDEARALRAGIADACFADMPTIMETGQMVAATFDGYWSLDLMLSGGQWYAIDMAPGERSWHPTCTHAGEVGT